jgi:osmotically inducible lipoprotein OsmB
MRKILILGIGATFAALAALPITANAQERAVTGAVIGATAGAVVAGPVGLVVGGVIGANVGGPRITPRQECWRDEFGRRVCSSR